ncbi:MAG: 1-acyl-sn-glycerol-3-phosphate acyltransferase [Gemmataceae bacterium]|nr:1-acyl-sn-glycerol-3-phosphate acyltransferase [Gemmataceae bacterium]
MIPPTGSNRWLALAAGLSTLAAVPFAYAIVWETGEDAFTATEWLAAFLAGAVVVQIFWHPYRVLGLVVYANTVLAGFAVYGAVTGDWIGWLIGLILGVAVGAYLRSLRSGLIAPLVLLAALVVLFLLSKFYQPWFAWVFLAQTLLAAIIAWTTLFRPAAELAAEPVLWVLYNIKAAGPGLKTMPPAGPCLVVANHACWFDPLILAKVLPRRVTPMMTARFYNLPVIRWFMRRFGVIRVNEIAIRKETPEELKEAVAALDRGECVLIFPESYLRRTEERVLRRFARGVWQILDARPDTPVFACWVEGAWGSYTSFKGGPPTKNKKKDVRRRIDVGVSDAIRVPADVLADHWRTRVFLMNAASDARKLVGLEPLPRFELPGRDEKEE